MRSLGNVLIKGWLSVPVKEGKYPSILHVHGYSSEVKPEWVCRDSDLVAFGLTIRGHGHSKDNFNPGFPGYLLYNIQDKETYVYRSAYMDCVRAMDFICSQPQVDTSRIVVEGASQGGALTIAVAALDQRVKAAIPMVPFLSDFPDYFKVANWPASEFANYVANHPEVGWTKVFETLNYIDIKNLAPKIKVPVLMEAGLCDDVCPLHINFAAYNNLSGPKSYIVYPKATHSVPEEFQIEKMKWIREQFKMGKK